MTPYTYLIGWKEHNLFYYGVRYAMDCHPSDLWNSYFTSSKYVTEQRKKHGDPDIIQIRKTFTSQNDAMDWESKVLRRMNVVLREDFINKTDNKSIAPIYGSKHSDETRIKMSLSHIGKSFVHTEETKEKIAKAKIGNGGKWNLESKEKYSKSQTGKNNNNFKGYYITPWGKFDSISEATKKSPMKMSVGRLISLCKQNSMIKTKNKYGLEIGKFPSDLGYRFEEAL